jgi:hypothetical protein
MRKEKDSEPVSEPDADPQSTPLTNGSEHADPDPQHCSNALYYLSSTRLISNLNFFCIFIPPLKGWNDREHFLAVEAFMMVKPSCKEREMVIYCNFPYEVE